MAEIEEHPVELRGAVRSLLGCYCDEVLLEGPAGTGKTRGLLERNDIQGQQFPGCRILWVRQTLKSLRQSVMVTWEDEVLLPGNKWMHGRASRETRDSYKHENGTEIVLAGADTPEKFLSTQFDFIYCWEARELSSDTLNVLISRNRNGVAAYQQIVFDTNPAGGAHHLNKRFPPGYRELPAGHPATYLRLGAEDNQQVRLLSRHEDNPGLYNAEGKILGRGQAYKRKLDRLTGARRRNLRDGEWASEEGAIWESYDEAIHLIDPERVPHLEWFFFSFDKGVRHPACLQVWGVDSDDRMYRVAEVYRVGMDMDWWADRVVELDAEFRCKAGVSDHHPEWIKKFNDHLVLRRRPGYFRNANKDVTTGLQLVETQLSQKKGGPRIFFVRGALRYGRCPQRDEELKPACTEEEISDYVWAKNQDGRPQKELPEPTCADHGCDATRYAAMFRWKKDMSSKETRREYPEGTLGHVFGHDEVLDPLKRRRKLLVRRYGKSDTP